MRHDHTFGDKGAILPAQASWRLASDTRRVGTSVPTARVTGSEIQRTSPCKSLAQDHDGDPHRPLVSRLEVSWTQRLLPDDGTRHPHGAIGLKRSVKCWPGSQGSWISRVGYSPDPPVSRAGLPRHAPGISGGGMRTDSCHADRAPSTGSRSTGYLTRAENTPQPVISVRGAFVSDQPLRAERL